MLFPGLGKPSGFHFNVQPFLRVQMVGNPVLNPDTTVSVQVIVTRGTNNPNYQQHVTDINLYVSDTKYDGNNNYDPRYSKLTSYSGNVKVYIATHSLVNYSSWKIVSPEASLASLPG